MGSFTTNNYAYKPSNIEEGYLTNFNTAADNMDAALKTAYDHSSSSGTDHSFINQSVVTTATPIFASLNISPASSGYQTCVQSSYSATNFEGSYYAFRRYGGTVSSPSIVGGDSYTLGALDFFGYDGSTLKRSAQIAAFTDGTPASGLVPGKLQFSTTDSSGATNWVLRLRASLEARFAGNVMLDSANGKTLGFDGISSGQTVYIQYGDSNHRIEGTYGTITKFRSYNGFEFVNNSGGYACFVVRNLNGGADATIWKNNVDTTIAKVTVNGTIFSNTLTGGATTLSVDASGNIIRTPSDPKMKENIRGISFAEDQLMAIQGISYEWKKESNMGSGSKHGFNAESIEQVVPEAVSGGGKYKSLDTTPIVALLVEQVKALTKRVRELEAASAREL